MWHFVLKFFAYPTISARRTGRTEGKEEKVSLEDAADSVLEATASRGGGVRIASCEGWHEERLGALGEVLGAECWARWA